MRSIARPKIMRIFAGMIAPSLILAACGADEDVVDEHADTTGPPTTVAAVGATTTTVVETTTATGGSDKGYEAVETALTEAQDLWAKTSIRDWAYLLEVDCDCSAAGSSWVRRWAEFDPPQSVGELDGLYVRIATAIESQPDVIEVEFSVADGHPVSYRTVDGDSEFVLTVKHFHEITDEPTPYDGRWKFTAGSVDGAEFGNPPQYIEIGLDRNRIDFPILCNQGFGTVDIYGNFLGFGIIGQTDMGCGESPDEEVLFAEAMRRIDTIALNGDTLVLSGPDTELRFGDLPPGPQLLGQLELTSAGALLSFDPPGDNPTTTYIITDRLDGFGRWADYLLEATSPESEGPATWERWLGEPEEPIPVGTAPGPHTIAIPDDIQVGDYYLCSPYWEPEPFCFGLPVRLPSAPWIIGSGPDGVVLHDANGTSDVISTTGAQVAFLVGDRLVLQPLDDPDRILIDDIEVRLEPGALLLDAAHVTGRTLALVSSPEGTATIDLDTGERTDVGPPAVEGRLHGGGIVLRAADHKLSARNMDGELIWDRIVDEEAMLTIDDQGNFRLDTFRVLQTEAGSEPYFQYIGTEILDPATGETLDQYEEEVAIPDLGQEIDRRCVRAEFQNGILLCPQPDGRIVTLRGDILGVGSNATYARPGQ